MTPQGIATSREVHVPLMRAARFAAHQHRVSTAIGARATPTSARGRHPGSCSGSLSPRLLSLELDVVVADVSSRLPGGGQSARCQRSDRHCFGSAWSRQDCPRVRSALRGLDPPARSRRGRLSERRPAACACPERGNRSWRATLHRTCAGTIDAAADESLFCGRSRQVSHDTPPPRHDGGLAVRSPLQSAIDASYMNSKPSR